jgi:hypothetical protein
MAILWCLGMGWDQFNDLGTFAFGGEQEDVREQQIQRQLKDCRGTFQERYDCKSAILRAHGRDSFYYWAKKYALTFGPALFLYVAFHFWLRSVETVEEKARRERRMQRIEARKAKEGRFVVENSRRRALAASRRQEIRKAEAQAMREEKENPLNMLVVSQDERWRDRLRKQMWDFGYYVVHSDLRDVFLSYREIPFHVVLTETQFKAPDVHPEDLEDEEFPGKPLPLKDAIHRMRQGRDSLVIVACSPEFEGISAQEFISASTSLGVDAVIEKPFEPEKFATLLETLRAMRKPKKLAGEEDEVEEEDGEAGEKAKA